MKVADHRDLVRDPAAHEDWIWRYRRKPKRQCWAVAHKNSRDRERSCMFTARPEKLTCGVHAHLEDRARMLKNANKRLGGMMKVYVASSWRNEEYQQGVVHILEDLGHEIYDFRNPPPGEVTGFHWRELDPKWEQWDPKKAREALDHPTALKNYDVDKRHLDWADICVYVTPCGKSASWEAGYMAGQGKTVIVLLNEGDPELMYKLADFIVTDYCELIDLFQGNLIIKAETWLKEQFEHELCAECGGDAGEHTAVPMFGNWFARCDQPAKK